MAGRLPGVGLLPRKRTEQNHRYDYDYAYAYEHHLHATYLRDQPWISLTLLDETALKARQRLHKKLGHFFSSYRSSESPRKEGKQKEDGGIGRKLLESSWLLRGNKFKKERKVCAVCLEDFGQEKQIMNLSCSHKYHSACLIPWLQAHPHCPYCRTPVVP
ncbi:E3 ubiquitin-protein ligase RNF149 isoform X4 [Cajanus cajan]|uniref:RING finger protein 115 family n=1 Tax=Cajanus cajan TaxID=3821 RepID=A0A151U6T3_CAJCA|nr:E3 ubiquitin-protein ligase RNF149 isoform X4 [Cajanus cajan]KYP74993.1 RING finger protein 115 family [Cajanus cajan]